MQLNDKVIIITGGCQGLGRCHGRVPGKPRCAKLALVDLNPEKLECGRGGLPGPRCRPRAAYLCNVADEDQVTQTVAQIAEDFRRDPRS
jgi:3-oxoacyl-[acyl-carrier protein] reductase